MQEFEFPTNIKQIGSISGGSKIYVEDYVCSYLQQYAESWGYKESLAILLGRQIVIDGQKVMFISGTVQGKYTKFEDGIEIFTDETWDYVDSQINKYFKGLEILGWVQSQPGYSIYLNANYANYHFEVFQKPYQVMFVIDPLERSNAFFIADHEKKELIESKGYFVYYDKNEDMHEYMLDNKVAKDKIPVNFEEDDDIENYEETPVIATSEEESKTETKNKYENVKIFQPRKKSASPVQRRLLNMLVSVSAVLFLISFVMGIGLMQNEDRITKLESDLDEMQNAYLAAIDTIKNGRTENVFAGQAEVFEDVETTDLTEETAVPAAIINEDGNKVLEEEIAVEPETTEVGQELMSESIPEEVPESISEPVVEATTEVVTIPEVKTSVIPETYVVEDGDNLLFISVKFYGTTNMIDRIMQYNDITDPDKIVSGKKIKLPPVE